MAWPHIYIFRAAKTVADFRNGVKSGEAQKGHVFSALSQIPNIDRRLWVRHGALPKDIGALRPRGAPHADTRAPCAIATR
jgi:hypothetical protein